MCSSDIRDRIAYMSDCMEWGHLLLYITAERGIPILTQNVLRHFQCI